MRRSILDPNFKYVSSTDTDIRKTIAREKRRLKKLESERANDQPVPVLPRLTVAK